MTDGAQDTGARAFGPVPVAPRVLHSDPHDFAGLYVRHRTSFTLHARRYLNDRRDAEEVVQEAFLRLFLALPELDTELQALAYGRRTITNLCIDRYRAQARRPRLVDLDSVPPHALAEEEPADPVVRAEDAAVVRAALSLLSPLHREALIKREIEEKPLPVIAAELDIAEDSVKHVLFRARRALRRLLAGSSLAPGGGAAPGGALGTRVSGKGLAVVVALAAVVGLSAGPDLRALPVVGVDLPSLRQIAAGVGEALRGGDQPATSPAGPTSPVDPGAPLQPVVPADGLTPGDPAFLPPDPFAIPLPGPISDTSTVLLRPEPMRMPPAAPERRPSAPTGPASGPASEPASEPASGTPPGTPPEAPSEARPEPVSGTKPDPASAAKPEPAVRRKPQPAPGARPEPASGSRPVAGRDAKVVVPAP